MKLPLDELEDRLDLLPVQKPCAEPYADWAARSPRKITRNGSDFIAQRSRASPGRCARWRGCSG
eukprot:2346529-Prymnesium_polylepis.1